MTARRRRSRDCAYFNGRYVAGRPGLPPGPTHEQLLQHVGSIWRQQMRLVKAEKKLGPVAHRRNGTSYRDAKLGT